MGRDCFSACARGEIRRSRRAIENSPAAGDESDGQLECETYNWRSAGGLVISCSFGELGFTASELKKQAGVLAVRRRADPMEWTQERTSHSALRSTRRQRKGGPPLRPQTEGLERMWARSNRLWRPCPLWQRPFEPHGESCMKTPLFCDKIEKAPSRTVAVRVSFPGQPSPRSSSSRSASHRS